MILIRRIALGTATMVIIVGLASCTTTGTPSPATTSGGEQSSSNSANPSLKIASPRNLQDITDPCQLLTKQQLQELNITATPQPGKSLDGTPDCKWQTDDVRLAVTPDAKSGGIGETYRRRENFDNFKETKVSDSYPAARVNFRPGTCGLYVGVADGQELDLIFTGSSRTYPDACPTVEKAAAMMINNLPPKN